HHFFTCCLDTARSRSHLLPISTKTGSTPPCEHAASSLAKKPSSSSKLCPAPRRPKAQPTQQNGKASNQTPRPSTAPAKRPHLLAGPVEDHDHGGGLGQALSGEGQLARPQPGEVQQLPWASQPRDRRS